MFRIYVERKSGFESEAARIFSEITGFLGITGVMFSLAKSVVGRAVMLCGTSKRRFPYLPRMMRISFLSVYGQIDGSRDFLTVEVMVFLADCLEIREQCLAEVLPRVAASAENHLGVGGCRFVCLQHVEQHIGDVAFRFPKMCGSALKLATA